jgi:hypothetical protein
VPHHHVLRRVAAAEGVPELVGHECGGEYARFDGCGDTDGVAEGADVWAGEGDVVVRGEGWRWLEEGWVAVICMLNE